MFIKTLGFSLLIAIAAKTCNQPQNTTPMIEDTFSLQVVEKYRKDTLGSPYHLMLETVSEYSCANYGITYTAVQEKNTLHIKLDSVELMGEMCLTAFAPAKAFIDIPADCKKINLINGNETDTFLWIGETSPPEVQEVKVSFSKAQKN